MVGVVGAGDVERAGSVEPLAKLGSQGLPRQAFPLIVYQSNDFRYENNNIGRHTER